MATSERTYTDAEVEERLKTELPHWHLEGGWIRRRYRTSSWKGTLMVINAVGHLAEVAWHHPDITASYAWVEVRLMNHAAKGITDKDFALAKKIEEVVHWQPGLEGEGARRHAGRGHALRLYQIRQAEEVDETFSPAPRPRHSRACTPPRTCLMVRPHGDVPERAECR